MQSSPDQEPRPIVVLGAGTLGQQIALTFATCGEPVRMFDPNGSTAARAVNHVKMHLAEAVAMIPGGTPGTVSAIATLAEAVAGARLVIESVPENAALKREVLATAAALAPDDAILASNSSSLPTSRLAGGVARPERLVNMHFYLGNKPVEVMSCGATDPAVIAFLMRDLPRYGLVPFEVRKESMGFIYNRIWAAIKREALAVVAEGVATPQEVDTLYTAVTGGQRGPFRRMDAVGLDVVLDIERNYAAERTHLPEGPRTLLQEYVEQGRLGAKSGRGFYDDYGAG